ncbi:MAG: hypothetical protein ACXAC5_03145 [Promethearchaeota archaeon]|jgi:hypothetical protein
MLSPEEYIPMNWMQRIAQQATILWHATTADLAEEIIESGEITPSLILEEETGRDYSGWNFDQKNQSYGEGVYLAKTPDLALYYATIRLRGDWDAVDNPNEFYFDENLEFLGLFKIHVLNVAKLRGTNQEFTIRSVETSPEVEFLGRISNKPNSDAWFEGPFWVSRSRDMKRYTDRSEQLEDLEPAIRT